ncbi:hypothetical protein CspeluHIS016_0106380 [Cutaneotrichosporon spelunceum]|uniref:HpcH/HpaI aldolase/citrate lyase domain-containing protein n=1 Tax=Cutaneotrichosporon spelunceum TaxID=1672016 RepID=A0AAD3Y9Q5_9TREE|nr:hypothetical protein CspeluHIS016_0106380 [Cutaneotrichosporon spelunceum]
MAQTAMQARMSLKHALARGEKGRGFWLTFPASSVARSILSTVKGFNWVLIDGEHGMIGERDYYELCNAVAQYGATPIVRIPNAEEALVKRALDAGAHGIMTPMCHTAEDARKIVAWNKYPPRGSRGYGPMFCGASFGVSEGEYAEQADDALMVMVQIESRAGVENVEEIAKVDGLDVLFIGPYDLSKSMNVEFGGEEHSAAIARILKAAHDNGKKAAIFCADGKTATKRFEQGFDMANVTTDIGSLVGQMARELAESGGAAGEKKGGAYS